MIGNDVIDLPLAVSESDPMRRGFLEKIFTPEEISLIVGSDHGVILIWQLWSMKEASYKIWNRKWKIRAFNPLNFQCEVELGKPTFRGKVYTGSEIFHTSGLFSGEKIHTVCVSEFELLPLVASCDGVGYGSDGLPRFDGFPASKSHHGRFTEAVYLPDSQFRLQREENQRHVVGVF